MKHILYLTMAPIDESSGVYKKIISQTIAFYKLGYECKVLFVRDSNDAYIYDIDAGLVEINVKNKVHTRNLKAYLKDCDFCYVRFELLRHFNYHKIILLCICLGVKVVTEIPTYPPYQESLARVKELFHNRLFFKSIKTLLGTLLVIMDVYLFALYSKMVVLVADDKKFLFSKTLRIENGINIDANPFQTSISSDKINIIAVSNFSVWNGYDRALVGLKKYIDMTGNHDIRLIMVGNIESGKSLIKLAKELNVLADVEFTGALSGKELDKAYAHANLALCALGNHRRKVYSNSSLKAKEYAARGMLMVISEAEGIENEIKNSSFIVKSDESPLDFTKIRDWYVSLQNKEQIRQMISAYAKQHFSWNSQIQKIIQKI